MKLSTLFILPTLLVVASGCTSAPKEAIAGLWSIDTITTKGEDIKSCFLSNVLVFESDGICTLLKTFPEDCPLLKASVSRGNWALNKPTMQLIINSQNVFFDKKYHVRFIDDTLKRMLVMRLTTLEDTIICRKGLYSYNKQAINNLVSLNTQ